MVETCFVLARFTTWSNFFSETSLHDFYVGEAPEK